MRIARLGLVLLLTTACGSALEKARTARDVGAYEAARAHYERAMKDPQVETVARQELATLIAEGAAKLEKTDPEEAEREYERALELDPVNGTALTGLIRMFRRSGRIERAEQTLSAAAATGPCGACNRLSVVLLLDAADHEAKTEQWDRAIETYTRVLKLRPQPRAALAIAHAHAQANRRAEAIAALERALELVPENDVASTTEAISIRGSIVTAALEADEIDLADRASSIAVTGEAPEPRLELVLAIIDHLTRAGKLDDALARYERLLSGEGDLLDSDAKHDELSVRVANIHANRATAHLHDGEGAAAEEALAKALELRPADTALKLQRIIAVSSRTGAEPALAALQQIPSDAVGWANTRAILLSLRAIELVEAGDLETARSHLAEAQKARHDLPEVHLAAACILARTPIELDRKEKKALASKRSMVRYGRGVHRYAEALGELDWVHGNLANRTRQSLFTAAWLKAKTEALSTELRGLYPFEVKFRADPEPRLVLKNEGTAFLEVSVQSPDHTDDFALQPDEARTIDLPDSGLVTLHIGNRKQLYFAEPYTQVTLPVR